MSITSLQPKKKKHARDQASLPPGEEYLELPDEEEGEAPPPTLSSDPLVLAMPDTAMNLEKVTCKEPSLKEAYVLYDRFTHSSGNLRCFTACCHHQNCRKYTFVRNHKSKEEAEAWLLAWNALGKDASCSEAHKGMEPTTANVARMLRFQALY